MRVLDLFSGIGGFSLAGERATDTDNARCSSAAMANAQSIYAQRLNNRSGEGEFRKGSWWATEPNVGRVVNGVPNRVDRIKGLGNAIVPQVAYQILKAIKEI